MALIKNGEYNTLLLDEEIMEYQRYRDRYIKVTGVLALLSIFSWYYCRYTHNEPYSFRKLIFNLSVVTTIGSGIRLCYEAHGIKLCRDRKYKKDLTRTRIK